MQTYHVNIDNRGWGNVSLIGFVNLLSEYGSPRIVSYDYNIGCFTMVLEFLSRAEAVAFAQAWYCESNEGAEEYVRRPQSKSLI